MLDPKTEEVVRTNAKLLNSVYRVTERATSGAGFILVQRESEIDLKVQQNAKSEARQVAIRIVDGIHYREYSVSPSFLREADPHRLP